MKITIRSIKKILLEGLVIRNKAYLQVVGVKQNSNKRKTLRYDNSCSIIKPNSSKERGKNHGI